MQEVQATIENYIKGDARAMQIATVGDDQPWICTVYYVADDDLNLYWLSLPSRRHSQEIAAHNKVAAAIVIKADQPVVGVQVQGTAEEILDATTIAAVMQKYVAKYDVGKAFYDNFIAGNNQHRVYRIRPETLVLFDEVNFTEQPRNEWRPSPAAGK